MGFTHLVPKANPADLVMLSPGFTVELRDYIIATKSFVFWLTSTNSAEKPVMNQIISARPANTPIMGWIPNEGPDVADLSSLGHFPNASDCLDNESDWAAMPSPASLASHSPSRSRYGQATTRCTWHLRSARATTPGTTSIGDHRTAPGPGRPA